MRRGVMLHLWKTTKGFRLRLAVIFAATVTAAYLRYGLAVTYQHAVDSLAAGSLRTAFYWLAAGFGVILIWNGSNYVRMMLGITVSGSILKRIRAHCIRRYVNAPFAETESVSLGETMTKLTDDAGSVSIFFTYDVREICFGLIQLGSGLWFAFRISFYFGLVLIAGSLVCVASNKFFVPRIRKQYALQREEEDSLKTFAEDRMRNPAVTAIFHLYDAHASSFKRTIEERTARILRLEKIAAVFSSLSSLSGWIMLLSLYGTGIILMYYGKITIGGFISIFHTSSVVLWPFEQFPQLFKLMAEAQTAMERLLGFEDLPREDVTEEYVPEKKRSAYLEKNAGHIQPVTLSAENLSFWYKDGKQVLQDFSYEARIGGINCIAGESGSGKTTFIKLLLRLYAPERGMLFFRDAAGNKFPVVRSDVSYVPQDCKLFTKTVLENIRDGRVDASLEAVYAAAEQSGAHSFIQNRELQYETPVEEGASFSYGQKQRIAIARALLKDAKLIIFDEPTSALDAENEQLIISLLQQLAKEKIVIAVSHSPALIAASAYQFTMGANS